MPTCNYRKNTIRLISLGALVSSLVYSSAAFASDMVIFNAKVTTLADGDNGEATAVVIDDGLIEYVGSDDGALKLADDETKIIDAKQRRLIPGLIDSHSHYLRSGLSYTRELRWDGVSSLADALDMVRAAAEVTPEGEWVRVIGGWTPWQFDEQRLPTPEELTAAAPDTPVYAQYFYSVAIVNEAGRQKLELTDTTVDPVGGKFIRRSDGTPTGTMLALPHPRIFYDKIAGLPSTSPEVEANSTLNLFRDLAEWGLTSVIDAGGGGFRYPDDYSTAEKLAAAGDLPLRTSFYLFASRPEQELEDFAVSINANTPGANSDLSKSHGFELDGAGEYLLWEAGDFENFRAPRPVLPETMEANLEPIIELLVRNRWPFRIHGTYDESITRILDVIERVDVSTPLDGLRWSVEHAETITPATVDRIAKLHGGVAIQNRMVFLGDDFVERYGAEAARFAPPIRYLYDSGIPMGMGTDATRGSTFNPWVSLHFLVTGETASGRQLYGSENVLTREEALRVHTIGSAWFSGEETVKGRIAIGQFADLVLLDRDYMKIAASEIPAVKSVLTIVDGKPVFANADYAHLSPAPIPVWPKWSPLRLFPAYASAQDK